MPHYYHLLIHIFTEDTGGLEKVTFPALLDD